MKRIFYAAAALVMLLTVGVPLWTVVPKESKATFFNGDREHIHDCPSEGDDPVCASGASGGEPGRVRGSA